MATLIKGCHQLLLYSRPPSSRHSRKLRIVLARSSSSSSSTTGEWAGLEAWRGSPLDKRRTWGPKNRSAEAAASHSSVAHLLSPPSSLAEWGALVLNTPDPLAKAAITHHAYALWSRGDLPLGVADPPPRPARPAKPVLVPLRQVPDVKKSPLPQNAHSLHVLAHIELNAVDLAWDTVVRFSKESQDLDKQFFTDFAHVADDESRHFCWCSQRLSELGCCYGDIPAHNALVEEGQRSAGSVMARLAVVPMVQEARGLDSGPRLAARLVGMGDARSAGIVNQIAEEELAHVAVGVSWFMAVCKRLNRVPDHTFKDLLEEFKLELKGPFNHDARAKAGLPREWYDFNYKLPLKHDIKDDNRSGLSMDDSQGERTARQTNDLSDSSVSPKTTESDTNLSKVYDRLALIIAMENERAA